MLTFSKKDPAYNALCERMGPAEMAVRLQLEKRMLEGQGEAEPQGLFRFQHLFDVYDLIRFCLKISGMWDRAQRNYLNIQVERNEVVLERLPVAFDGFTILQLTDLHADLHPDFPAAVVGAIEALEYDCLAVTGDFRTCTFGDHSGATEATIEILKDIKAPCYATLGNHDFLAKVPLLEAAGVQFLLNENVTFRRGTDELHIVGIDDPNYYKSHNFEHALAGVPDDACKVLLSHSPEIYRAAQQFGFDFLMAGHTHGGQICLPGGRVLVHDRSAPRHLLSGVWREGQLQGYTSRGTGASGLPVRLNCMPEVTLHVLRCGSAGGLTA
jgi:uncharacterized protein